MTALNRILKNTSVLAFGQIANPVIAIFLTLSIARLSGAEGLGVYTFVISILVVFEILAGLGIRDYVIREVARRPEAWGKYFSTAVIIGFASVWVLQGALLLFSRAMGYGSDLAAAFFIVSFSLLPTVVQYFAESIFYANQQMGYASAVTIGENLLRALFGLACLYSDLGLQSLFWVFVFSRTLSATLLAILLFRKLGRPLPERGFRLVPDKQIMRDIFKIAPTFLSMALVAALYWRLDILFLSKFGGSTEVGIYTAAYRLMYIFHLMASSLMTALFPLFSKSFAESTPRFRLLSGKALKYLLLILFPVATATVFVAPPLVTLLYGEAFKSSIIVLQVIIWMIIPLGVASVFANTLIASNQQKRDLQVNAIRLVLGVLFNALLAPKFGGPGAAIAMMLSLILGAGMQYGFLSQFISTIQLLRYIGKPLLASLFMAGVMMAMANANIILAMLLGVGVYVLALLLQDTFNGQDRVLLETLTS